MPISVPSAVPQNRPVSSVLEDSTDRSPETSLRIYHSTMCKIPQERRSHLQSGGSVKEARKVKFGSELDHKYA